MNRVSMFAVLLISAVLAVSSARADEVPAVSAGFPASPPSSPGTWSVDLGASLFVPGGAFAGSLAGPQATLSLERRLGVRWAVMLSAFVAHDDAASQSAGPLGPNSQSATTTGNAVGASASLRFVINPGSVIEVSPFATLGAYYGTAQATTNMLVPDPASATPVAASVATVSSTMGGGLAAGLLLEHELVSGVWLRVDSSIARVSYAATSAQTSSTGVGVLGGFPGGSRGFSAGLSFQPEVALRLAF